MTLLDVDNDTIFVDFTKVVTKTVPVLPRINLSLAKNYEIEDSLSIEPRMVKITGPKSQIDSIRNVRTSFLELLDVDKDFSVKSTLVKPRELDKTVFEPTSVTISGKVYRFSEKVYNVPVTILNVPDNVKVRMFPDVIKVVCQAKLERLKEMDADDFLITADYAQVTGSSQNIIPVKLSKKPKGISNAILSTQEIEFILRRE
nr:YbbR-like domain-containing protein [Maribacter sp. MMG018]